MRLRHHLFAMTLIPLLIAGAMIVLTGLRLNEEIVSSEATGKIVADGRLVSAVIHEIQKERGYSAGFVGSGGRIFAEDVALQRDSTDAAISAAEAALAFFAGRNAALVEDAQGRLESLSAARARIDALEMTVPELAGFYTGTVRSLIELTGDGLSHVASTETQRLSVAYLALMEAKEAAGLERAMGAVGFGSGVFAEKVYARFLVLRGQQLAEIATARSIGGAALAEELDDAIDVPARERVEAFRAVADASVRGRDIGGPTGPEWFAASTAWVDALKVAEDLAGAAIEEGAAKARSEAQGALAAFVPVAAALIGLSLALPGVLALTLERAVARVLATMRAIAENRLDIDAPDPKGKGEIAEFARAAAVFLRNALARDAAVATAEEAQAARADLQKAMAAAGEAREREALAEERRAAAEAERAAAERLRTEEEEVRRRREEAAERGRIEKETRRAMFEAEAAEARRQEQEKRAAALSQLMNELGGSLRRLADGDLTCRLDNFFSEEFKPLRLDFNEALGRLGGTIGAVTAGADEILRIAEQVNGAARDLAIRTERQAATLETNGVALRELDDRVTTTAEESDRTLGISESAKRRVDECGAVMGEAMTAMDKIEKSSTQIATIVTMIEDIAFQTNLLALNAGVEAARVGDAGRGFAVIASEVRALAMRAAQSSQEIRELVESNASQITDGVRLVKRTGDTLEDVAARFVEISSAVSDLSGGAAAQSKALEKVNEGASAIDAATRENAAMAEETTAAASELAGRIRRMTDDLAGFRIDEALLCAADKWEEDADIEDETGDERVGRAAA